MCNDLHQLLFNLITAHFGMVCVAFDHLWNNWPLYFYEDYFNELDIPVFYFCTERDDERTSPVDFRGPFGRSPSSIATMSPSPSTLKQSRASKLTSSAPSTLKMPCHNFSPRRSPRKVHSSTKVKSSHSTNDKGITPELPKTSRKMLGFHSGVCSI